MPELQCTGHSWRICLKSSYGGPSFHSSRSATRVSFSGLVVGSALMAERYWLDGQSCERVAASNRSNFDTKCVTNPDRLRQATAPAQRQPDRRRQQQRAHAREARRHLAALVLRPEPRAQALVDVLQRLGLVDLER